MKQTERARMEIDKETEAHAMVMFVQGIWLEVGIWVGLQRGPAYFPGDTTARRQLPSPRGPPPLLRMSPAMG